MFIHSIKSRRNLPTKNQRVLVRHGRRVLHRGNYPARAEDNGRPLLEHLPADHQRMVDSLPAAGQCLQELKAPVDR